MQRIIAILWLGLFGALACSPPGSHPDSQRPNLVFLMLDAARADFFSISGHPFETTPEMDRMAREGLRFASHFSHSQSTMRSLPQLFTSRLDAPSLLFAPDIPELPWWTRDDRLDPSMIFLPSVLNRVGYRTVMVTAHAWTHNDSQFGQMFDETYFIPPTSGIYAEADAVVDYANRILEEHRSERDPRSIFLYVHFLDSHTPHVRPKDQFFSLDALGWSDRQWFLKQPARPRHKFYENLDPILKETFHGAVRSSMHFMDREIGRLVKHAEQHLGERTVFAVTSDHGDALGEGGMYEHTPPTFGMDATHHIPMIFYGDGIPAGEVVEGFTGTVDVLPTILRLIGLAPPQGAELDGRSMLGLDGKARSTRSWIPLTQRTGWRKTELGFRSATYSGTLGRNDILHLGDGGPTRESTGKHFSESPLAPEELQAWVRSYRKREAQRQADTSTRHLNLIAQDLTFPPGQIPACWQLVAARDLNEGIQYSSRDRAPGYPNCEPATLEMQLPPGTYQATLRIFASEDPGPHTVTARLGDLEVEKPLPSGRSAIELGTFSWPRPSGELKITFSDSPLWVDLLGLDIIRPEVEPNPQEATEDNSELIEQLKSLGYLQ